MTTLAAEAAHCRAMAHDTARQITWWETQRATDPTSADRILTPLRRAHQLWVQLADEYDAYLNLHDTTTPSIPAGPDDQELPW